VSVDSRRLEAVRRAIVVHEIVHRDDQRGDDIDSDPKATALEELADAIARLATSDEADRAEIRRVLVGKPAPTG